jgi:hypothetical protein
MDKTNLHAIQSMLTAGHRSVQLERHSLLLIGATGGFLSIASELVITNKNFPDLLHRGLALLMWLSFWLGGASALEHKLTRRLRAQRDQTLPFAQAQITRAWWMLLCMGCLGSFAMMFYGGGGMVYAFWIALLGLGVFFFGLFSQPLIEWIGLATLTLGACSLGAGLPYGTTRWLCASCFLIGMPLAGWLNTKTAESSLAQRAAALLVWLVATTTPALLVGQWHHTPVPQSPMLKPGDSQLLNGERILQIEKGANIPLYLDLDSPLLQTSPSAALQLTLQHSVAVALEDGTPDGRYRIGNGEWHRIRDGVLHLRIDRITPKLNGTEPQIRLHANVESTELKAR